MTACVPMVTFSHLEHQYSARENFPDLPAGRAIVGYCANAGGSRYLFGEQQSTNELATRWNRLKGLCYAITQGLSQHVIDVRDDQS